MAGTNGTNGTIVDLDRLTPGQKKAIANTPLGSSITVEDRLFRSFTDFHRVYESPQLNLRLMRQMLTEDGNPKKLEQVLSLPLRGADREIRGDGPALQLVKDNVGPLVDRLIDQCTSAIAYAKAFFETEWMMLGEQVVYKHIHLRPAVVCEAAYHDTTGEPDGFRQQISPVAQITPNANMGWIDIPANRSFIYRYGSHREPLRGVSDLDVALHAWENIQKLRFLYFQFLEQQSLPKMIVFGNDPDEAQENAENLSEAGASATLPMARLPDPQQKLVELIESSGSGAGQFIEAIRYLEGQQTQSVLASFTDLAQAAATGGRGSNALSADQSEFFLGSRQAIADEMSKQITEGIIKPLVVYNYGPDAPVPTLHIGPIGNRQTDRALDLLKSIIGAATPTAPTEFTGFLLNQVSSFLGLDADKVATSVEKWGVEQAQFQSQQQAAMVAAAAPPPPGPPAPPTPAAPAQLSLTGHQMELDLSTATPTHTGGMIALVPDKASAAKLAVTGDNAEAPEQLHLTLAYLGDDVTKWTPQQRQQAIDSAHSALAASPVSGPVDARAFAHTTFNADGGPNGDQDPCAVYGIGHTDQLGPLRDQVVHQTSGLDLPAQHQPFVPHVTAGYGMAAGDLSYLGPVRFDRMVVALGDTRHEIPLGPTSATTPRKRAN